ATVRVVEQETAQILERAVKAATATIQEHRLALDKLFAYLLTHETAEREELVDLLGPPLVAPNLVRSGNARPDGDAGSIVVLSPSIEGTAPPTQRVRGGVATRRRDSSR